MPQSLSRCANLALPSRLWGRHIALASLLAIFAAGCKLAPERKTVSIAYTDAQAKTLSEQGDHGAAAHEYLRIARIGPAQDRAGYLLSAAAAFLAASDAAGTQKVLAHQALSTTKIEDVKNQVSLLRAKASLLILKPQEAKATLTNLDIDRVDRTVAAEARKLLAEIHQQAGDFEAAARERVQLELLLTKPQEIADNRDALWESLATLPRKQLAHMRRPSPDTLGGWIELALLREQLPGTATEFERAMEAWAIAFPGHPANKGIVPKLRAEARTQNRPATHIALLLPLSGQFSDAARAIRDGFLASWFAHRPQDARPQIRIYDTEGHETTTLYAEAVSAGADFVVGPLRKEAVRAILLGKTQTPTLALNVVPRGDQAIGSGTVYQFGLAPENEAEQVARRARLDGYKRALILAPKASWGERVSKAFRAQWEALGGTISEDARYGVDPNALANTVRNAFDIDDSDSRAKRLSHVIDRKIQHEPRRRRDIDMIFLAGFPRKARQLRPQIEFFRASTVPVYATSHVFSGELDPNADGDINGIIFGDMPWVLSAGKKTSVDDALRQRIFALWSGAHSSFTRFYAFGADAERLVNELGRLRSQPQSHLKGYTGTLSVSSDLRVSRKLQWAKFEGGVPKLLTSARDR